MKVSDVFKQPAFSRTVSFRMLRKLSDTKSTYRDVWGIVVAEDKIAVYTIAHIKDDEVGRVQMENILSSADINNVPIVTFGKNFEVSRIGDKVIYHKGSVFKRELVNSLVDTFESWRETVKIQTQAKFDSKLEDSYEANSHYSKRVVYLMRDMKRACKSAGADYMKFIEEVSRRKENKKLKEKSCLKM